MGQDLFPSWSHGSHSDIKSVQLGLLAFKNNSTGIPAVILGQL
jgi:hypothetical protein